MQTAKIILESVDDMRELADRTEKFDYKIELVSDRYVVNAKSVIGVFSLSLKKPIELQAYTDDAAALFESIAPFLLKEEKKEK